MRLITPLDHFKEYIFLLAIGWCLGLSELEVALGLSAEIGAFVAGVAWRRTQPHFVSRTD
jgi:Kef-type K+ transport system membrane component KefB